MTHTISAGWAHIHRGYTDGNDYGMSLRCTWMLDVKAPEVRIEHYPGDGQYGFDLGTRIRSVTLTNIYFENSGDAAFCLEAFEYLQGSGAYELQLQVHSDDTMFPIRGGTGDKLFVLSKQPVGKFEKIPFGDGQVYRIGKIRLEEAKNPE